MNARSVLPSLVPAALALVLASPYARAAATSGSRLPPY